MTNQGKKCMVSSLNFTLENSDLNSNTYYNCSTNLSAITIENKIIIKII